MNRIPRSRRRWAGSVAVVALVTLVAGSCTAGGTKLGGRAPAPNAAPPRLYVAMGAGQTRGIGTDDPLRQSWPQDVFRTLPANYRLLNLALPRATVAVALTDELPIAESVHAALVTVWLNVNDVLSMVPAAMYRADLTTLLHRLRASGATVLVANTPPLDHLPAYRACLDPAVNPGGCPSFVPRPVPSAQQVVALVEAYNAAISIAAAQEGALVVDLYRAGLSARAGGTEASSISADGFDPNAAGSSEIAALFGAVVPK